MRKKSKMRGSVMFGTAILRPEEVVLLATVIKNIDETQTPEQVGKDIMFIDECLQLLDVRCLTRMVNRTASGNLRKDANLQGLLMKRLDHYIKEESFNL